ncbi:MAG: FAD-dependent oxidoreductase [Bacteroidota bacterium]
MQKSDILIIGGGVFGMTAAIELAKRAYQVSLINPDTIPHHLAASTDVTKVVRMEYGSDTTYFEMAEQSIALWRKWNDYLGEQLYHEVGFLMLGTAPFDDPRQRYEQASIQHLQQKQYPFERLRGAAIADRFPALSSEQYEEASFNPVGGYVESAKVIAALAAYAKRLGVHIYEGQTAQHLTVEKGHLTEVKTKEGATFSADHTVIAAGAHTPLLLPALQPFMKPTGHPVFFLRPSDPSNFLAEKLPVFTADISNTGWYGFPYLPELGIVKVAKHTTGLEIHPDKDDRLIYATEVEDLRQFLKQTFPELVEAPVVYTRRCLYTDTLDGHFWIDQHPTIKGLSVSSGGSGHGMKMAPVLGAVTADMVEGKSNPYLERFRWRELGAETLQIEEARFIAHQKL